VRKTIIVHVEGFSSQSPACLHDPSPLERAVTPHLDRLARTGEIGQLQVPGESRSIRGALALLALLGYDTSKYYSGSGPFVAAGLEVKLEKQDVAFVCDLVTLRAQEGRSEGRKFGSQWIMEDPTGGGVTDEEARELIDAINEQLVSENIQFYLGHRHEHLMVWAGMGTKVVSRSPLEAVDQAIESFLPTGDGGQVLRELMEASRAILDHHELNRERIANGEKPANCLWMWSPGKAVELLPLNERWPVKGVVIASDNAVLGAGAMVGFHMVRVDAVQVGDSPRLSEAAELSLKAVAKMDLVYVHVSAEGDGRGSEEPLVEFWEQLDTQLIGPLQEACSANGQNRLIVVGSPTSQGPGSSGPSEVSGITGYVLCDGGGGMSSNSATRFHERALAEVPVKVASKFFERLAAD